MPLPRQILDEIRDRTDIVDLIGSYVTLKRAGASYKGLCPFHREKTPSFHVHPARQVFHCFGCGAGGDVFKFVMLHENVDFMDAVRLLAQRAGISLQFTDAERSEEARKDLLYKVHEEVARFYHEILLRHPSAESARAYLAQRQLGPDVVERFGLGYAPGGFDVMERFAEKRGFSLDQLEAAGLLAKNEDGRRYDRFRERLMFPIRDLSGRVIAFSGRILAKDDRTAKYLNSPETPLFRKSRTLFAMDLARAAIIEQRLCLLCEGQIDVIRCHMAGFTHAVAALGTALTEEHAAVIKRHADQVVLVMDADTAGQNSALRSAEIFLGADLNVEIAGLPVGEDPDSLILKHGAEAMRAVLGKTRSVVDFHVDVLAAREDISTDTGARRVARAVLETVRRSSSEVQRRQMLHDLSSRLSIPEHVLREELRRIAPGRRDAPAAESSTAQPVAAPLPPEERQLLWLIVHRPQALEFISRYLTADHLSDPRAQTLFRAALQQGAHAIGAAAREAGEECLKLASELITDECRPCGDDTETERIVRNLILVIRRSYIERTLRAAHLQRERASVEDQRRLTEEIAHMKYDLIALREGWERAALILEL